MNGVSAPSPHIPLQTCRTCTAPGQGSSAECGQVGEQTGYSPHLDPRRALDKLLSSVRRIQAPLLPVARTGTPAPATSSARSNSRSALRCPCSRTVGRVAVAVLGMFSSRLLSALRLAAEWDEFTRLSNVKRSGDASGNQSSWKMPKGQAIVGLMYAMHGKMRQQHSSTDSNSEAESREIRIFAPCSTLLKPD